MVKMQSSQQSWPAFHFRQIVSSVGVDVWMQETVIVSFLTSYTTCRRIGRSILNSSNNKHILWNWTNGL